jgi:hypothetical protein
VQSFNDLTPPQKQDIAQEYISRNVMYNRGVEVFYILGNQDEDSDNVPFCDDDMVNNEPKGNVEFNGYWHDLTEEERDEKLGFYGYLRDKACGLLIRWLDTIENPEGLDFSDKNQHIHNSLGENYERFDEICDTLEGMEFEDYPEIYQWFLCPEVCYRLRDKGEVVLNNEYWGRQCCGQSIILDHVIQEIAFDVLSVKIGE